MKYCGQCGAQLVDSAKFCSVCGSRVSEESQSQSAAEVSRSSGDTAGTSTLGG